MHPHWLERVFFYRLQDPFPSVEGSTCTILAMQWRTRAVTGLVRLRLPVREPFPHSLDRVDHARGLFEGTVHSLAQSLGISHAFAEFQAELQGRQWLAEIV
jgi:hypothetical protein